jgi:hypothetical protein
LTAKAYQINVASFHREQVKKIAEASKPVKLGVIYDNRRAEDEDGCTVREYLRSLELVGNIKLSVLAPKEGPPDDSDQALWEFINF